jgi:hypothetical protein
LPPEGQEETQLHAERRGTGPTTLASFQRTTGNSQSKRSSQPPLPAGVCIDPITTMVRVSSFFVCGYTYILVFMLIYIWYACTFVTCI